MGSYFFFRQGEKRRQSLCSGEYFQRSIKEKERVKWVGYIFPTPLPKLFPNAKEINRKADRIVKIPLKNGNFQWLIIHIEVQGYKDANFARRMFSYYYRLADRFDVPIAAIVIYSDDNQENRVSKYESNCLNTRLLYEFDTYVIADHSENEYAAMDNPFAIILQTALIGRLLN